MSIDSGQGSGREPRITLTHNEDDAVEAIRSFYHRFEYASRRHAQFELVVEVGIRLGALRAVDLDDLETDEAVIHLQHRPVSNA